MDENRLGRRPRAPAPVTVPVATEQHERLGTTGTQAGALPGGDKDEASTDGVVGLA
ncbi:hypothetical protein ACQE98_15450 [Ornithinimicrobium sp. W1679]|uniref:hypothetical protein n=1 Tax=unclassified Ornithinimicrobium TaxID=2615080 RepID=UPI003CFA41DE